VGHPIENEKISVDGAFRENYLQVCVGDNYFK